jgi:hypothetical protein
MLWNAISGNKQFVDPAAYKALAATGGATKSGSTGTLTFAASHGLIVGDAINLVGFTGVDISWNTKAVVTTVTSSTVVVVSFPEVVPATSAPATTTAKVTTSQWTERSDKAFTDFHNSNAHQLAPLYLIFKIDSAWYRITGAAINQATINFAIDGIAMVEWQGMGFELLDLGSTGQSEILANAVAPSTSASFIVNKLSTVTMEKGINGGGTAFVVPITGGSVTISNNLTFLTPDILGTVNRSIGYFTGTRAVSGNLTAYLRTGAGNNTAALLADVLASAATEGENFYKVQVEIGGLTNATRVELLMPAVQLQVPTVSVEDVISTEIGFTAQGYTGAGYDIEKSNELVVSYYGV